MTFITDIKIWIGELLSSFNFNINHKAIMTRLDDVVTRLDALKEFITLVDANVEALYDLISENTDISEAAKAALLAKIAEIQIVADKISTND